MKAMLPLIAAVALAGCVQTGVRYLNNNTVVVSARGNGFAKPDQVQRSVMEKAASFAVENGYSHFSILGSADATSVGIYQTPSTANTQGVFAAQPVCCGSVVGAYSQRTTYTPGAAIPIIKPGMDVAVRFYHEGEAPRDAFRAIDYLKKR
jgi:hypothetical protein